MCGARWCPNIVLGSPWPNGNAMAGPVKNFSSGAVFDTIRCIFKVRSWSQSSQAKVSKRLFLSESFQATVPQTETCLAKVSKRKLLSASSKAEVPKRMFQSENSQAKRPKWKISCPAVGFLSPILDPGS